MMDIRLSLHRRVNGLVAIKPNDQSLVWTWSICRASLTALAVCSILLLPLPASAHIGGKLLMVYGLSDEDLSRLDLDDGSTTDWQDVVGDPSYWADALDVFGVDHQEYTYNPTDLDFRFWLAWNASSGRIYGAYESVDDHYILQYVDDRGAAQTPGDYLSFMVDGDHSGGIYNGVNIGRQTLSTAQQYLLTAGKYENRFISSFGLIWSWYLDPPYADAHGSVTGEDPVVSVIEFYITPFDDMVGANPESSVLSQLWAGKIIGLDLSIVDPDTPGNTPWSDPSFLELSMSGKGGSFKDASLFVDAILLAPRASSSAVTDLSWARIKAGFQQGR